MSEIKPKDYQRDGLNEIYTKLIKEDKKKILYQLATAGGKTYVFSFLAQHWIKKFECKTLVLCHRDELIDQTVASMNTIGVTCEVLKAKVRKLNHNCGCYVAMIETAAKRLEKNPYFFKNVGLIICDEAHVQVFQKVFDYFPTAKILGCTATPIVSKRVTFHKCRYCKSKYELPQICCDEETDEWSKPFAMSNIYEDIVVGPGIDVLIQKGNLVKELAFVEKYVDESVLQTGSNGEVTTESYDEAYTNDGAAFNVLLNYEKYCLGKKTMIFNGSAKGNLMMYNKFLEAGYNVRMYDSVNKEQSGKRKDLVEWFRAEDDAILLNVGCFVAGFDVKEVEAIILNLATMSLSSYIQMCGRGARSTDQIYKPYFILVDGGGNIERHLEFSDPTRDWRRIFFEGIGPERSKKIDATDIEMCMDCGALYPKTENACPECGYVIEPAEPKSEREILFSDQVLVPIRKIPPPSGEAIYNYTVKRGENINFAFKILINNICDLFKFYCVTKAQYEDNLQDGRLLSRVKELIRKPYFYLLNKKDIQTDGRRTIKYLEEKALEKIADYYSRQK